MASAFARKLATLAQEQHDTYHMENEADPKLSKQIKKYWTDLKFKFPGVATPWSAVFVSWCVRTAGATKLEFLASARHAEFVYWAIQNAKAGTGLFRGYDITAYAPKVGDIIQNNRNKNKFTFAHAAKSQQYESHSALVTEMGEDANGRYALTIGGNESDSIRRAVVHLDAKGFIIQRPKNQFISVIENLK